MSRFLLFLLLSSWVSASLFSQPSPQRPLDQAAYDRWTHLEGIQLSRDGSQLTYERQPNNPFLDQGWLYWQQLPGGEKDSVARGYDARFAPDASYLAFKLAPFADSLRKAKLAGKKGDKLPQDSLAVWVPAADTIYRFPQVKRFAVPEKTGLWLAFSHVPPAPAPDTTTADSTSSDSVDQAAKPKKPEEMFTLFQPLTGERRDFGKAEAFTVAENGHIAFALAYGDSIDSVRVLHFSPETERLDTLFDGPGYVKQLSLYDEGEMAAFLHSPDTGKVKIYALHSWTRDTDRQMRVDTAAANMPAGWSLSEHGRLRFSKNGQRLFFGTAPIPPAPVEDSLPKDELARLDVWHWEDDRLQPEQLKELAQDRKKNFLAVLHLQDGRFLQLGNELVSRVELTLDGDGRYAEGQVTQPYNQRYSWEWPSYRDYVAIDVETGAVVRRLAERQYPGGLSPAGKYLYFYEPSDRNWYTVSVATGEKRLLTGKVDLPLYDEEHDSPSEPYPYGLAGWGEEDAFVVVEDRYDLWKIDPEKPRKAVNLTGGYGREHGIRFSYEKLDREAKFLPDTLWLEGFGEQTKRNGFFRLPLDQPGKLTEEIYTDHRYLGLQQAAESDRLVWRRSTFTEYPDLWTSGPDFSAPQKLSDANPQQDEYRWGSVELVSWTATDGTELDGLLYLPEGLDTTGSYPLMVYFYEKRSDGLHGYSTPAPSRSTVYPSTYVSNGYAFFIPDIVYQTGQPGPDAVNCVVSGTKAMLERYKFLDAERVGIQGQSWGGYQTAYIVTQTDLYAAAMAGAPVSNMTSAYGGIRWGSGLSRMFQYEETQSRLGATLWEDRERYLANSPVFFAPQITTPLLMMHNDADGAVPWYQGIEMFVAMRRLGKPAWLLVYNDEEHNLTRWPNRMDLDRRMKQFFDHYLMGAPAPKWQREGVPAVDKGRSMGYEVGE